MMTSILKRIFFVFCDCQKYSPALTLYWDMEGKNVYRVYVESRCSMCGKRRGCRILEVMADVRRIAKERGLILASDLFDKLS